jgi:hypothetical protein
MFVSMALFGLFAASGCASAPKLTARMDDARVRSVLSGACAAGSTESDVQNDLDSLGVSHAYRTIYAGTGDRPRVLLARVFDGRGFWLDSDDTLMNWLDISFVFAADGRLERTLLFRDKMRYAHGEPITYPNAPRRMLQSPPRHYPAPIPPPADPLEGAM